MTYWTLWHTMSDKLFHSDVLSEIDFMHSKKESENKDTECIFCNGKYSEVERGEIWINCFSCSLRAYTESLGQRMQSISMTFMKTLEGEMVYA